MANQPTRITRTGNLVADPKPLAQSRTGKPVTEFRIAVNRPDQTEAEFYDVTVWEDQARHVTESLHKGDRVTVYGRLEPPRPFERKDGSQGVDDHSVTAYEVSASLLGATAELTRQERTIARDAGGASSGMSAAD
jgi:single-strand DNA-binding protein